MSSVWSHAGSHPGLAHLASELLASAWQAVVLVLFVAVALRLVPRLPAAMRHAAWAVTFVLVLGLPLAGVFVSKLPQALPSTHAGYAVGLGWALFALAVWLVGSSYRATELALSLVQLRRLADGSRPLRSEELAPHASGRDDLFAAQLRISRLRKSALLCASPDIDRPGVIGFFRPRILLPETLLPSLTPGELHQILLHEMEHLRRWDDWLNFLQKAALVLFPLNPALWWVERRLCFERELACDEGVLRATRDRKSYALCLVTLAERTLGHRTATLLVGAWSRRSELSLRIGSMLGAEPVASAGKARASGVALLATACLATAVLARSPQFISFRSPSAIASPGLRLSEGFMGLRAMGRDRGSYVPVAFHPAVRPTERAVVFSRAISRGGDAVGLRHRHVLKSVAPSAGSPRVAASVRHGRAQNPLVPIQTYASLLTVPSRRSPAAFVAVTTSFYAAVPTADCWLILEL